EREGLQVLDVAAGGCDIGDALVETRACRVVSLDLNPMGLRHSRRTMPVVGDGTQLPFRDSTFDAVICSLSFHHLTDSECETVLKEMWRTSRGCVLVNDLHRHPVAYASIWVLAHLFSKSVMVKNDGPVSVRRAFRPADLKELARRGIDAVAFERDAFPREKVCGGFLSPGAVDLLEEMNVLEAVRVAGAVE